ncbi:rubber dioxygenase RoxB [Paraliomyxa miuraensis]|uniref:rubber dioxygenase RoxB n=1 Tax=Paraliomyxa miuraensis TaxID=376150 RepID=UPI0022545A2C|nr:hypothetical protein [Paraliomyxa miuraensis]MCX4245185.1 hypothetical protein [Paraliomyxa miuraensis]
MVQVQRSSSFASLLLLMPVACSPGPSEVTSDTATDTDASDTGSITFGPADSTGSGSDTEADTEAADETGTGGEEEEPFYCGDVEGYDSVSDPEPSQVLWSSRGGWALWDYCLCRPDDTVLPQDPRSMVQPGVSDGRAVAYNTFWKDCHVDPEAVGEAGPPTTCGELRERIEAGAKLMTPGEVGAGAMFSGTEPVSISAGFGIATFPASAYNSMWLSWGLPFRPANFDELVSERYGAPFGPTHNPYPLPGEDPNLTNGGSGQLPYFFTQMREPDGAWTGTIGMSCHGCHSGAITGVDAPGFMLGSGSPLADHNLFLRDMLPLGYLASVAVIANLNRIRGANNASDINLAFFFPEAGYGYDIETFLGLLNSGSTAGMNTPAWWNMGHRALKFVDGVFPMDSPRIDMVFFTPFFGLFGGLLGPISEEGQDWMREHGPPANDWVSILKSPEYPYEIDEELAMQGAQMFHTLDLWAPERDNPVRDPEAGNGSCASCHGAYSPLYFNDPSFVASPRMEGVASYITPIDVIGTDPVRLETNNEAVQQAGSSSFFGYPQTYGTDQDCGPQNREDLAGDREPGYLAPPLFGVWATAPYFHNGSVPNLWEVLKPDDRKRIWERRSTPSPAGQENMVMGFDIDLERAFDKEHIGWIYDEIACEVSPPWEPNPSPYLECDPSGNGDPLLQILLAELFDNIVLAWNILYLPPLTKNQMEERKVFNTHMYGQGNEGHEFTAVLTDWERAALIEYLKTL